MSDSQTIIPTINLVQRSKTSKAWHLRRLLVTQEALVDREVQVVPTKK